MAILTQRSRRLFAGRGRLASSARRVHCGLAWHSAPRPWHSGGGGVMAGSASTMLASPWLGVALRGRGNVICAAVCHSTRGRRAASTGALDRRKIGSGAFPRSLAPRFVPACGGSVPAPSGARAPRGHSSLRSARRSRSLRASSTADVPTAHGATAGLCGFARAAPARVLGASTRAAGAASRFPS
jgi:hypothetical protein